MTHAILHSRSFRVVVAVVALSFGVVAGVGSALPSHADTYTYAVYNYPGSGNARVYCGWHTTCLPGYPSDGDSIDWPSPTAGTVIYWRSWSSNTQGLSWAGTTLVVNGNNGNCYRVDAELKSPIGTHLAPNQIPSHCAVWSR